MPPSIIFLLQGCQQGPSVQVTIIAQESASVVHSVCPGHLVEAPGTASTALPRCKGENVTMGRGKAPVRRTSTALMDGVKVFFFLRSRPIYPNVGRQLVL